MDKLAQLIAKLIGVRFVTVSLRDAEISLQQTRQPTSRTPDPILSISIPASRVINFIDSSTVIERVVYNIDGAPVPLVFTKYTSEYIYDLETGELIEVILHGKVGL